MEISYCDKDPLAYDLSIKLTQEIRFMWQMICNIRVSMLSMNIHAGSGMDPDSFGSVDLDPEV